MDMNTKVFVYYNLHKHVWSVKALSGPSSGRVIMHCSEIRLRDVVFRVSKAGRNRVLQEQRKNVHAGAVGYIECEDHSYTDCVSYNPYKADYFYSKTTGEPVYKSPHVLLKDRKVWII